MRKKRKLTAFGAVVKKRLIDKDMTQVELAEILGTSNRYINMILYGERSGEKYLQDIIKVLELDPEILEKIA